ncbi:MAG: IS4 family transposase, partial [Tepidisphaeraceae bacterium]
EHVEQACRVGAPKWRERLLPPLVTLKLFVLQVLHGNTSITHLRQLSGIAFAPASDCEARARLPLRVITSLLTSLVQRAQQTGAATAGAARLLGQRVLIVDCSNFSMSDSTELHEHFHLPQGTKPGIGYPLATVMGLIDAATGMFVQMLCLPLFMHDMNAVTKVHDSLQSGDILLGDRAFCSFAHIALLNARGIFACFRLHQMRQEQGARGRRRWRRPKQAPKWMARQQYRALPQWIEVRLVTYTLVQKGLRTRRVTIATTLMDEQAWPYAKLAELYGQRWRIEGCFDHLKTTMNMNVLKCQSVEGVLKELVVYLLVYNLVRLAMLHAAHQQHVSVGRISFIDALRWLACRTLGLMGIGRLLTNPRRPGRWEPRVIRRRKKPYDLLTCPRAELKNAVESGGKC